MFFLSDSERLHLRELLLKKAEESGTEVDSRHAESDAHLVFEGLHVLANGNSARLYAMLHPRGHRSHPGANSGRTLLMMQRIEEYGSAGSNPAGCNPAGGEILQDAIL